MKSQAQDALRELLGSDVSFDEPMSKYTSLRVGGPADAVARPNSRDELRLLLDLCRRLELPIWIIGAGFNTLVRDGGIRGVVIRTQGLRKIEQRNDGRIIAECGVTHSKVSQLCGQCGLTGLEFAVGIPGTVGGWITMNAGIPQREMKDVVQQIEFFCRQTGELAKMSAAELRFRYRGLEKPNNTVLLNAQFRTEPDDPRKVRSRMKDLLDERRKTQPLDQLSCGSVFTNPPGNYAGRLIEAAGLKGLRDGDAEISTLHANFIVNHGRATAGNILRLIERAREEIHRQFGVELEPEVHIVGEDE